MIMSLSKCNECGHKVSKKAETCPSCGAKVKKNRGKGLLILIIVIVLMIAIGSQSDDSGTTSSNQTPTPLPTPPTPPPLQPVMEVKTPDYPKPLYEDILKDRTLWPNAVTLKNAQSTDIILDGEVVGEQTFDIETVGKLLNANESGLLSIQINQSNLQISYDETDFVESVHFLLKAKIDNAKAAEVRAKQEAYEKQLADAKKAKQDAKINALIKEQFSDWDGRHLKLTRLIKSRVKDPDSFKHIETQYWRYDDKIRVKMSYRAKNSFGGYVVGSAMADYTHGGNLIELLETE
jgi:RNA polymerase subunit RPABC4/transcription elongation factor Spt4